MAPALGVDGNWDNGGNPYLIIKHKTAHDPRDSDLWMTRPIGNADMLYEERWVFAPWTGLTEAVEPASEYYMGLAEEAAHIITEQFEEKMLLDFTVERLTEGEYSENLLAYSQAPGSCQGVNYRTINPDGRVTQFGVIMEESQCGQLGSFVAESTEHLLPFDFGEIYGAGTTADPNVREPYASYMRIGIMLGNMAEAGNP